MKKIGFLIVGVIVALIAGMGTYTYIVGAHSLVTPAEARPADMPANPHILYLAPQGAVRGLLNDNAAQNRGAKVVRAWQSARSAAASQPLDALLIDASLLNGATPSDLEWLRAQFHDGVVIIGLGTEDALLAKSLGVSSLRSTGEGDIPITAAEYLLVLLCEFNLGQN